MPEKPFFIKLLRNTLRGSEKKGIFSNKKEGRREIPARKESEGLSLQGGRRKREFPALRNDRKSAIFLKRGKPFPEEEGTNVSQGEEGASFHLQKKGEGGPESAPRKRGG